MIADVDASIDEQLQAATQILSPRQIRSIQLAPQHTLSLWVGAVSAGKTIASLFAFLIALVKVPPGGLIVIIGQTIQTIERNVIGPLQDPALFGRLARLTVHTRNSGTATILGRHVELIGAHDKRAESRIRGGTFALVYVDEATLLPDAAFWDMLVTRLRVKGARLLATTNPASRNHWLRRDWILRADVHDLIVFHLTMRDNPSLERSYVLRMFRSFVGAFFQRMILGLWTNAEGAVYEAFSEAKHVVRFEDLPPIREILAVGIDHGTSNATSAILLGITEEYGSRGAYRPRLVLLDEWRYDSMTKDPQTGMPPRRLTNVEQSAQIREWLSSFDHVPRENPAWGSRVRPGFVFVDPAAADFREQLSRDRLANAPADNEVLPGISEISSLFALGRLIVSDRCTGFLSEVTEYVWDPKAAEAGIDAPVKLNDHSLDAARYAIRTSGTVWRAIFRRAYGLAA